MSDQEYIKTISSAMLLKGIQEYSLPDFVEVEENPFTRKLKYRQVLQKDFRKRFRSEYLGFPIQRQNMRKCQRTISVGDTVLVEAEKNINWPLRRKSLFMANMVNCAL